MLVLLLSSYLEKNNMRKKFDLKDFLSKNIFLILGIILVVPWIKEYLQNMELRNKANQIEKDKEDTFLQNQNMYTQQAKRDKITKSKELQAVATKIANDLGTSINHDTGSWSDIFNPRSWTENDKEVANALIKYRNYFPTLVNLYNQAETRQRKLKEDLLKLLDDTEIKRVRQYIKI